MTAHTGQFVRENMADRTNFGAWFDVLDQINITGVAVKIQHVLGILYELSFEFVNTQKEQEKLKDKLHKSSTDNQGLLKKLENQNHLLEALGSTIVKLEETGNLDVYIPQAYRILSSDPILLTPPSDNDKSKPSNHSQCSQKSLDKYLKPMEKKDKVQIKQERESQETTLEQKFQEKVLSMNKSSDISVTDDSMNEIHATPTGRHSPVLGHKSHRSRIQDTKSASRFSPTVKLKMSQTTRRGNGEPKMKQTLLTRVKATRTINLGDALIEYGGGVRSSPKVNSQVLGAMKTSVEDDDVIQPSPTSENIPNKAFLSKLDIDKRNRTTELARSAPIASTPRGASPPHSLQSSPTFCQSPPPVSPRPRCENPLGRLLTEDETDLGVIEFDEPMETESLNASMDLLERHRKAIKSEPLSQVLSENRSPSKQTSAMHDTNVSVSVLRQPFGRRAERENLAPGCDVKLESCSPSPPRRSPRKNPAAKDARPTHCDGEQMPQLPYQKKYNIISLKKTEVEGPTHVYKEKTVRTRKAKQQLQGWCCEDCNHFYGHVADPVRKQEIMDRCSRHRGVQDPARHHTPRGFWDMHLSVPDDTEMLNRMNNNSP